MPPPADVPSRRLMLAQHRSSTLPRALMPALCTLASTRRLELVCDQHWPLQVPAREAGAQQGAWEARGEVGCLGSSASSPCLAPLTPAYPCSRPLPPQHVLGGIGALSALPQLAALRVECCRTETEGGVPESFWQGEPGAGVG
jgi:hypothetical protein